MTCPYTLLIFVFIVFAPAIRASDPVTTIMSPVASYQLPDDLSPEILKDSGFSSSLICYQYSEDLSGGAVSSNGGILTPFASYQYFEWPGDDILRLAQSMSLSYAYPIADEPAAPRIVQGPTNQVVHSGSNVTFKVISLSSLPLTYQWLYQGFPIPGAQNDSFQITNALPSSAGEYSVIVFNLIGQVVSSSGFLVVLGDQTQGVVRTDPGPSYPLVEQTHGKDSIVVLTHGLELGLHPDLSWLDNMGTTLSNAVPNNWQVKVVKWLSDAWDPATVLDYGYNHGGVLGKALSTQHWSNVHLIGHSAGANLIQAAAEVLAATATNTTVHTTFLDAYVGQWGQERGIYGNKSRWSDSYFARDNTGASTEGLLTNAFNVDVTGESDESKDIDVYCDLMVVCGQTRYLASPWTDLSRGHAWPHEWYRTSIRSGGTFGFPRSMEAGGWEDSINNYRESTNIIFVPPLEAAKTDQPHYAQQAAELSLTNLPFYLNFSNLVSISRNGLQLTVSNSSPQIAALTRPESSQSEMATWCSFPISVTNIVNICSFDIGFDFVTNGVGFLSVYWNTNQIAAIDQRATLPGLKHFTVGLPNAYANGSYALTFHLQKFSVTPTRVNIANVSLGLSDYFDLPQLVMSVASINGQATLSINGSYPGAYVLSQSTDLLNWTPVIAISSGPNGARQYAPIMTNNVAVFYRASIE